VRLEGARPWQELWHVYWATLRRTFIVVVLAVTALSLGEIGAGARVETPGWETFAKLVFDRMHYGVDNNVAALALIMLMAVAAVFCSGFLMQRFICGKQWPSPPKAG